MLKLYEAELPPDPFINADGLYMLVLAVDLEQAKKYIQEEFDESYPSSLIVDVDPILIREVEPPFVAGTKLCSFLYPNRHTAMAEQNKDYDFLTEQWWV